MDIVDEFKKYGCLEQLQSLFGFLFDSPLNGGRLRRDCIRFPLDVIDELNSLRIGYSFTLTNLTVAKEHLEDPHTNNMLRRFENPLNGVIVADDSIADYVRINYPGYRLRASCIYDYVTAEEINDACERFDEVCPFPEVNHKPKTLEAIKNKKKVTLFGTSICLNLCGKNRLHHYYILGQDHIAWYNHRKYQIPYKRDAFKNPKMPWCKAKLSSPMMHNLEELEGMGFSTFKITQFEVFKSAYFRGENIGEIDWTKRRLKESPKSFALRG
jgi:collagenase-like PrtC family protease